jgi:hypothetical protein
VPERGTAEAHGARDDARPRVALAELISPPSPAELSASSRASARMTVLNPYAVLLAAGAWALVAVRAVGDQDVSASTWRTLRPNRPVFCIEPPGPSSCCCGAC